ncbi:hypothetical protein OS493_039222 [Desmophyllum pertusum]|uniref:Uncharacterized protein n=1 Tax=Desmophyllum pertusum TaxID=174260 RepID=A0A9W9ZIT3_9CNID|nr:hypothetical protein OS493_039222 [Desmophyllum pertusum]
MAAVFFKYTTDKAKFSSKDNNSGFKRTSVEAFLTGNGWHSIGNQVFHSDPSFGTAKEQMLSQAKALRDIEELIKWKPSLKETFKDSLIIVGQVYDIDSLLNTSERKKEPIFQNNGSKTESYTANSTAKPVKLGHQPSVKSPESPKFKKTTRPARNRPMGFASKVTSRPIVNYPKTPVKTAKNKATTSMLKAGRCSNDFNSNLLSHLEYGPQYGVEQDDMTPLYLPCLEEDEEGGVTEGKMTCGCHEFSSYHVETFVKMDSCVRKLCCSNINVDPSERVVV